jgi:translation initiation factor 4B
MDPSRDLSDWSRKGPLPDLPNQRRVSDRPAFNRFDDGRSDAGSERGARRGFEPAGDGKIRDFGNWERKGPLPAAQAPPMSLRDGGRQRSKNGPDFRRDSPSWGEGKSQDGSRPPRREYEKPAIERAPTASELDNEWRARMRPDSAPKSPTPETSAPPSPRPAAVPATRPRLNLQKRTVSEADPTSSPSAAGDAKASPFGAARPVDTAAKEREVEEKRQLAIRERKEADEKAKAERAKEKRQPKEDGETEKESPKLTKQTSRGEEEGEAKPAPPKFDILRRANSGNNDMLEEDEQEEEADPTTDKEVKPKEVVVPASQVQNGSWRKAGGPKSPAAKTTAENLDEEGWSTVSKPQKQRNNRRGGPRAIAS